MSSDIHVYLGNLQPVLDRLDELKALMKAQGARTMATMSELQAQVKATTDVEQSAVLLLEQLHGMLVAAQASSDPTAVQTVINQLGASKDALAAAIVASTPAATDAT